MSARSPGWRVVALAGAAVAYTALLAFLTLLSVQVYRWFREGEWTHIGTSDGLETVLLRCCVKTDGSGTLADLTHWLDTPLDWLGLHHVLEWVPASLTLFMVSIVGNFVYIYCSDRSAAPTDPMTSDTA